MIGGEDVATGTATMYPSIAVDKLGNVAIGLGVCSPTTFASEAYTTRSAGDPARFMNPLTVFASGQAYYRRTFSNATSARNRWGDYTGTVVDPDECIFWSYNEYAGTQGTPTTVGTVTENGRWWTRAASYFVDDNANGNSPTAASRWRSAVEVRGRASTAPLASSVGASPKSTIASVSTCSVRTEGGARMIIHVGLLTAARTMKSAMRTPRRPAPSTGCRKSIAPAARTGSAPSIWRRPRRPRRSWRSRGPVRIRSTRAPACQFSLGAARQGQRLRVRHPGRARWPRWSTASSTPAATPPPGMAARKTAARPPRLLLREAPDGRPGQGREGGTGPRVRPATDLVPFKQEPRVRYGPRGFFCAFERQIAYFVLR